MSWKVGDEIALCHNSKKDVVTVKKVNDDGSATIDGTIDATGTDGENVQLVYPASVVTAVSDYTPTGELNFLSQDGTLEYIAANLDYRVGFGQLAISGSKASLKAQVTMQASDIAIWKLSLTDGTNPLSATAVTLKVGTTTIAQAASAAKSDYYLCVRPEMMGSGDFTIEATVGSDTYTYTKAGGISLAEGKYYQSTLQMTKVLAYPVALSAVTADYIGSVLTTDGNVYKDKAAATAAGTTAVAMIAYVGEAGSADASSATYKGLALALEDVSVSKTWCSQYSETCLSTQYSPETDPKGDMAGIANTDALCSHATHTHAAASAARNYNSGTHPTGTSAWFLPSAGQWDKMATAAGGYANLKTNADLQSYDYWSSSERTVGSAWVFYSGNGNWTYGGKDNGSLVRACLAF